MRTRARLVCAFMLVASAAAAQSTTEDGIRAMVRGDYQGAARILRPLADDSLRPDPAAQFFLALVYDANRGIGDNGRACGLFLRAARQPGPFAEQAAALADAIRNELGGGAWLMCVVDEHWQGGPPQAFDLGPGHRIVFADTSVTVTYGDSEQRAPIVIPPDAGMKVEYTPLDVTRPVPARRHFFQLYGWAPDTTANPSSWTLGWALIEVVGDRWIHLGGEPRVTVVNSPSRPTSYDVSGSVRLRINSTGEAEYVITSGSAARTVVISAQGGR